MTEEEVRRLREALPYEKPTFGTHFWVADNILPNAAEIAARCLAPQDWELGFPHAQEFWPGKRRPNALLPDELAVVEGWVKQQLGASALEVRQATGGGRLSHNYVQLVGEQESGPRPHTDSRELCTHAAVIYLQPRARGGEGGTTFYRLRLPDGSYGGNLCPPPHHHLTTALGVRGLPLQAWAPDVEVPYVFNRILLYRAHLVHSASSYFGVEDGEKRMTALFFWYAR